MKKIHLILAIYLAFSCAGCAIGKQQTMSPKVQKMVQYAEQNRADKAVNLFKGFNSKEMNEFEKFLETNPEKLPPIYFIASADRIFNKDKDKAVLWYFIGKIRSTEDVLMCKDKSARAQLSTYPMLAQNTLKYAANIAQKSGNYDYMSDKLEKAVAWSDLHPQRVNPVWSCYHGMQVFINNEPPKLLPQSEFPKIQKQIREEIKKSIEKHKSDTISR